MIDRRRTICLALAAAPAAWLLPSSSARADQAFQRFFPLLIDLEGWQGNKPDGFSMETSGANMVSAAREYHRGPARFQAQVLIGQAAQGALAGINPNIKIETPDGHMITSTIDGLQVTRTFNTKDQSGALLIVAGASTLLSFSFKGIGEEEGLTLAKKFDWKAIQAAAQLK